MNIRATFAGINKIKINLSESNKIIIVSLQKPSISMQMNG